MRIYVGNLSYTVTRESLEAVFAEHGEVEDVHVPTDRESGRPRGFAFVTMPNDPEAQAAMTAINGTEIEGRAIVANEARPKRDSGGGGRRW